MGSKDPRTEDAAALPPRADDFKRIQGIGPVIEGHLHDAGIRTYAQLAALSPDDIVRLVENLPLLSIERIAKQDWPGQARTLAAQSEAADVGEEALAPEIHQRYATFTVQLLLDNLSQVRRTDVVHVEDGEKDRWAGWDEARLMSFFAEYAAIYVPSVMPESPAAAREADLAAAPPGMATYAALPAAEEAQAPVPGASPPEIPTALRLEVGDMMLDELPPTRNLGGRSPAKRLCAQLDFRLAGTEADRVAAERLVYAVQIVACNLATGQTAVLAVGRERLIPDQLGYAPVVEFALPDDGRYQLVGIVLLPDEYSVGNVLGPVLRVIP